VQRAHELWNLRFVGKSPASPCAADLTAYAALPKDEMLIWVKREKGISSDEPGAEIE